MDYPLNKEQASSVKELHDGLEAIRKTLSVDLPSDVPTVLMDELQVRIGMLATTPRLIKLATAYYNWAKGMVAQEMVADEKLLNAKQEIQRMFISGKMANYEAMHEEATKMIRSLELSIEGLRTMISFSGKQIASSI